MTPTNTVTARRETREVKTVVAQPQDMIVLEMPLEVASVLMGAVGSITSNGPKRKMMTDVFGKLYVAGVRDCSNHFTGALHELP